MDRFIELLLKRLEEYIEYEPGDLYQECPILNIGFEHLEEEINKALEEYAGGWIHSNERVPEKNDKYLCTYKYESGERTYMQVLSYYATDKEPHFQHESFNGLKVIAWQPITLYQPKGE